MNVVDSSAWLEYFADGPNARFFSAAIENTRDLVVSTINLYEVFRRVAQQRHENAALPAVAVMEQGRLIPVDEVVSCMRRSSARATSCRWRTASS